MEKIVAPVKPKVVCEEFENNFDFLSPEKRTKLGVIQVILKLIGFQIEEEGYLIGHMEIIKSKSYLDKLVSQIPWVTYRKSMEPISGYKSDEGWGGMIRVAQMMLANTFVKHNQYRFNEFTIQEHMMMVLPQFLDNFEGYDAPMSIRNILRVGKKIIDKGAGQWYGAHSISQVIKEVHLMYNTKLAKSLQIMTFNEGVVYKSELTDPDGEEKSYLVSIPLRVGLDRVDQSYIPQLKEIILYPDCVGVLGGKKHAAMYYIGFNNSGVLTLDPHTTQKGVNEINEETLKSYRTTKFKHLKWSQLDTTMAFGFYLNNEESVQKFYEAVSLWKKCFAEDYLIGLRDAKQTVDIDIDIEGELEDDFEII